MVTPVGIIVKRAYYSYVQTYLYCPSLVMSAWSSLRLSRQPCNVICVGYTIVLTEFNVPYLLIEFACVFVSMCVLAHFMWTS